MTQSSDRSSDLPTNPAQESTAALSAADQPCPAPRATGWLASVPYQPPAHPGLVNLDIVTVTYNRPNELLSQAKALAGQLTERDRWIIVDDASPTGMNVRALNQAMFGDGVGVGEPLFIPLVYRRGQQVGTINRARQIGCSAARPDAWIVEIDDHDIVVNDALDSVREAICAGAVFVYGDVVCTDGSGRVQNLFQKPDYIPWLLRDSLCPCEGVRAFPKWLFDAVGGYRWSGPIGVGGNEFPAGDYGLYLRMEQLTAGQGWLRIPKVLNVQPKVVGGISTRYAGRQMEMAQKLRMAAQRGELLPGLSLPGLACPSP